jgi:hypothetical protein
MLFCKKKTQKSQIDIKKLIITEHYKKKLI